MYQDPMYSPQQPPYGQSAYDQSPPPYSPPPYSYAQSFDSPPPFQGQPSQSQNQPNWLVSLIMGAVVTGIVTIIVNHIDAIAAAIGMGFTHINWSNIWSTSGGSINLTIISAVVAVGVTILSSLIAVRISAHSSRVSPYASRSHTNFQVIFGIISALISILVAVISFIIYYRHP